MGTENKDGAESGAAVAGAATGSARTAEQKLLKAILMLDRLERECLVPDFAHDASGSCPVCRLTEELKSNDEPTCCAGADGNHSEYCPTNAAKFLLKEVGGHLYTKQDIDRCRELVKAVLAKHGDKLE